MVPAHGAVSPLVGERLRVPPALDDVAAPLLADRPEFAGDHLVIPRPLGRRRWPAEAASGVAVAAHGPGGDGFDQPDLPRRQVGPPRLDPVGVEGPPGAS